MATTTNYSWTTPDDTALVKDGAAAIRSLGTAIDTTVFTNAGAAIAKTIVDAKGDLIAATAADTVARLAYSGTNGDLLTVDTTTATGLKWVTPAAPAGGMTLISTTTLTGATVTLSSIPQTYIDLKIYIRSLLPATDNAILNMRFNGDSGSNRYKNLEFANGNNANIAYDDTKFTPSQGTDDTVAESFWDLTIPDYANTVTRKMIYGFSNQINATTTANFNHNTVRSYYNQTSGISSLDFFLSSGNFTSGTLLLYGVK